jgi:tRNA(Ile)-lysidine synthase
MTGPITAAEFTALLDPLGPFEPAPCLAVAVSGGADSLCLALLADAWASARGGGVLALIVDHGLRPGSAAEAALTLRRLATRGIAARLHTLTDLRAGPALAERARVARYAALRAACADARAVHLLLGHHAGDQAETVLMRRGSGSGPSGLAAMPALREEASLRLLRPLLAMPPGRLRATLRAAGLGWVEDPSNRDRRALRARLRAGLADPAGTGAATRALGAEATAAGAARAVAEAAIAAELAIRAAIHPEGYALLSPGPIAPAALAVLLRMIGGGDFAPPPHKVARLAVAPRPATLGGVRLMAAGRLGDGWLLVREQRAMGPPVEVAPGAVWDGRFRLGTVAAPPIGLTLGALGADAARLRRHAALPAAVLHTLPAVRRGKILVAVPHLLYPDATACAAVPVGFCPPSPSAGAPFVPVGQPVGNLC